MEGTIKINDNIVYSWNGKVERAKVVSIEMYRNSILYILTNNKSITLREFIRIDKAKNWEDKQ